MPKEYIHVVELPEYGVLDAEDTLYGGLVLHGAVKQAADLGVLNVLSRQLHEFVALSTRWTSLSRLFMTPKSLLHYAFSYLLRWPFIPTQMQRK